MPANSPLPIDAERPVAFFANGIGDALLTLPALRALTDIFSDRLTLVTHNRGNYIRLFEPLVTKRQIHIKSGTKCDWDVEEIDSLAESIGECDLFISLVAWFSSSLDYLIERLHPAVSIGYCANYDIALPRDYTKHTAELTFDAVRAISSDSRLRDFLGPPSYPEESNQMVKEIKSCLGSGVRILSVHTETLPEKMWNLDNFALVLDRFLTSHPEYIAVLVGYEDHPLKFSSEDNQNRFIHQKGFPLNDALCLVHHSDCFLGIDSCMLHAADLGHVPSVGLFGPTSAHEFGFLTGPNISIQGPSDINRIEVDRVFAAMESILRDPTQRAVWHL